MTVEGSVRRVEDAALLAGLGWSAAEAARSGQEPVASAMDAAAAQARAVVYRLLEDIHATGPFRPHLAETLTGRALAQAIIRAGGARTAGGRPDGWQRRTTTVGRTPWTVGGMP